MRKSVVVIPVLLTGFIASCTPRAGAQDGCPSVSALKNYRPPQASRVLAADGSVIADLSPQRRIVIGLEEIPAVLREGFVAVEDRRFWQHGGIDLRGVARAAWRDLTSLSLREGASTIPMQLVRNVFPEQLPRASKVRRKLCEVYLAPQIEDEFNKREILELYLNQIYLGDGFYGVEAAAQGYFGKPAAQVSVAEAALLIGLVKSPEGYNPRKHALKAIRRRNVVLDVMAREEVITAAQAERAKAEPLRLAPPADAAAPAPYFVAAIRRELHERFGPDADTRGLRVHTALEPAMQRAAAAALLAHIEQIEAGKLGRYPHPRPPAGPLAPAGDSASPYLQGLVIALDPHTGAVKALVGGRDFAHSQFDRAFQARRQTGSAFKPLVYAAALQQGLPITTRVETTPVVLSVGRANWEPEDEAPLSDSVTTLSLRTALALSSNYAAVRLGDQVGPERVIALARTLGITTPMPPYPSIYLGAADVIPAEFVAAFAAFGNGGYRVRPQLVRRVEDARGKLMWESRARPQHALDEGVAYLTLSLMKEVVNRGTAAVIRRSGFMVPAAGKTGTTNDYKDAWFVGMTPDLVAGVWLGFDRPKPIAPRSSGGRLAAPVWAEFMKRVYAERPTPPDWLPPPTLVSLPVDTASGMIATGNCPPEQVRLEYFIPGTEPAETCPLHPETGVERFFERLWQGLRRVF
ncbi:MAG: PBP1A family penicillin-binding protein [Gemmatimonadetes bacterium]|nr:PBP1A family penicillin-binding protein [Gemmatimonadota bacterium]